jgi:hypothetical protein
MKYLLKAALIQVNDYRLLGASGLIDAMKYLAFLLSKQIFFVIKQMYHDNSIFISIFLFPFISLDKTTKI